MRLRRKFGDSCPDRQTGGCTKNQEAERGIIYDEFINRENELVNGMVQRWEKQRDDRLRKVEAVLPHRTDTHRGLFRAVG